MSLCKVALRVPQDLPGGGNATLHVFTGEARLLKPFEAGFGTSRIASAAWVKDRHEAIPAFPEIRQNPPHRDDRVWWRK